MECTAVLFFLARWEESHRNQSREFISITFGNLIENRECKEETADGKFTVHIPSYNFSFDKFDFLDVLFFRIEFKLVFSGTSCFSIKYHELFKGEIKSPQPEKKATF